MRKNKRHTESSGVWRTIRRSKVFIPDGMSPGQVFEEIRNGTRTPDGRLKTENECEVYIIGNIDKELYKCVTEDITTDELIITKERIKHIFDGHSKDFKNSEELKRMIRKTIAEPDYIVEANRMENSSALVLKEFKEKNERARVVLRLKTSKDKAEYKNSVISAQKVNKHEWKRVIRNKKVLYKKQ